MSSPLDGRIRALARAEAEQVVNGVGVLNTTSLDTNGLQQQITDLHKDVHHVAAVIKRLEDRLNALEKATAQPDQEPRTSARRTARKDTSG